MTAVEWLQEALEGSILNNEQIMQTIGLFEQAKEMEKKQIIDVVEYYCPDTSEAEQYYNETFKSE